MRMILISVGGEGVRVLECVGVLGVLRLTLLSVDDRIV